MYQKKMFHSSLIINGGVCQSSIVNRDVIGRERTSAVRPR